MSLNIAHISILYKAMGNEKRILALQFVKRKGPQPVWAIANALDLSFQSTSKHLLYMERVKLILRKRKGSEVYYALSRPYPPPLLSIISKL